MLKPKELAVHKINDIAEYVGIDANYFHRLVRLENLRKVPFDLAIKLSNKSRLNINQFYDRTGVEVFLRIDAMMSEAGYETEENKKKIRAREEAFKKFYLVS